MPTPSKQVWKFIGRDAHGWLGFRCVAGPGCVFSEDWIGDHYVAPDAYWV